MKPFVLVQAENGSVDDVAIYGVTDMVSIIVDWDDIETDAASALDLIEEIKTRFSGVEAQDQSVKDVLVRLNEIVDAYGDGDEEEEEYEDEYEGEDDEDGDEDAERE